MKWNKTARAQLRGFRRRDASDPPGAWDVPDAARAWEALRTRPNWTLTADAPFREAAERVRARCDDPTPPTFDPALELYRAAYLLRGAEHATGDRDWEAQQPERDLVRLWLATGGVAETLRLLLADAPFAVTVSTVQDAHGVLTEQSVMFHAPRPDDPDLDGAGAPGRYGFRPSFGEVHQWCGGTTLALWTAVRCAMNALPDGAFREAAQAARSVRDALDPDDHWARAALAFAFSRDGAFAAEALARVAARPRCSNGRPGRYPSGGPMDLLVLAAPDLDAARFLLPLCDVAAMAMDLVESFGAAAQPVLEEALRDCAARRQAAWIRKATSKRLIAALKVLGRATSLAEAEAEVAARRVPAVGTERPTARSLGNDRYEVVVGEGGTPSLRAIPALLPGTSGFDQSPWEPDPSLVGDDARGGAREFWVARVEGDDATAGAVRAWAEARGHRPATLREALAFHHAVPERLDAEGYIALGASAIDLPNLRAAPHLQAHKSVGPRLESVNVAETECVAEGDRCGVLGVDWRYRPVAPEREVPLPPRARVLLVRR